MKSLMKPLAIALGFAVLAPVAAAAPDGREAVQIRLEYDAAQLATPQGAKTVLKDLERQAKEACTVSRGLNVFADEVDMDCVDEVMSAALDAIDAPRLTALWTGAPQTLQLALRD